MTELFLKILNMSITACWIVFAAVLFRIILKNAPKNLRFILWTLVGIRLVFPFSFKSMFSMVPTAEPIPQTIIQTPLPTISNVIQNIVTTPNQTLIPENTISTTEIVLTVLSIVWLTGIAAMGIYAVISYMKIKKQVKVSIRLSDNIYICDNITSPFILGIIKPKIYLPSSLTEIEKECVIEHENAHIKRLDYIWKPLGFAILSVYWFNPVIWIAYILLCRDIELACDEKVIKEMDIDEKQKYSQALLSCSISRKTIAACPLAFGEVGVKNRIKSIINYKKPMFWVILISVIICIAVGIFFATDPKNDDDDKRGFNPFFNATVLETGENYILVEPFEEFDEFKTADKFYVNLDVISTNPVPQMEVGTELRIVYNGQIQEGYPAQIDGVFAIYLLSEIQNSNLEETTFYRHEYDGGVGIYLTLEPKNKTFNLSYPPLSSFGVNGTYEESDGKIICISNDSKYKYVFIISENHLEYSDEYPFEHPQYDANKGLKLLTDGDKLTRYNESIGDALSTYIWKPDYNGGEDIQFVIMANSNLFVIAYGKNTFVAGTYALSPDKLTLKEFTGNVLVFDRDINSKNYIFNKDLSQTDADIPNGAVFVSTRVNAWDSVIPSTESPEEKIGKTFTYVYTDYNHTAVIQPTLILIYNGDNANSFIFNYSPLSNYIPVVGTFTEENGKIILKTDDGMYKYVFDIVGTKSLSFNEAQSSKIPSYNISENSHESIKLFDDGALFFLKETPTEYTPQEPFKEDIIIYGYKSFQLNKDQYYIDEETGTSIIRNIGGKTTTLVDGNDLISDILFYDNKIYYCETFTSNLYVMDLNGENKQKLLDCDTTEGFYGGDFHSWYIYNGNLFLHSSMVLYKIDLSTYQWEIFNNDIEFYQIYDDCLYFIDHAKTSFTIYKQDLKTKEIEIVLGEGVTYPENEIYSNFVISEDGTFFITQRLPYRRLISYKDGKIEVIEDFENLEDYFDSFDELSLRYHNGYLYYVKKTDNVYNLYRYDCIVKQIKEKITALDEYKRTGYVNDNAFYYYKGYLTKPQDLIQIELNNK